MWNCMGRPECMTKLYPICGPGRAALLKLTDLGDMECALRKFYCADQAREAALAAYCRLACDKAYQKQILSCDSNDSNETVCTPPAKCNIFPDNNLTVDDCSYPFCVPSPYVFQSYNLCCPPCKLEEPCLPIMQFC